MEEITERDATGNTDIAVPGTQSFDYSELGPTLADSIERLAPEGRWYTNEPVALVDLWHRHPGPWSSFTTQPTQLRRDSGKPSSFWRRHLRYHASISPSLD